MSDIQIGSRWKHHNGLEYTIVGIAFFGDTDEWLILHMRDGSFTLYARSVGNFHGSTAEGTKRFTRVDDLASSLERINRVMGNALKELND